MPNFAEKLTSRFGGLKTESGERLSQWIAEAGGDPAAFEDVPVKSPEAPPPATPPAPTDGPQAKPIGPGSSSPENWETGLQNGMNEHQVRDKAKRLTELVEGVQVCYLELKDCWEPLIANGGKHLEMHLPIVMKNLSREKLLGICEILSTLANHTTIV
jgi:hypothetical protein